MNRRSFLERTGMEAVALGAGAQSIMAQSARHEQTTSPDRFAIQNGVAEGTFTSAKHYRDPFHNLNLKVVFTDPQGWEVPFCAGDSTWRVRFAPAVVGRHTYRTISTDFEESLHGQRAEPVVSAYRGDNPLRKRGFICTPLQAPARYPFPPGEYSGAAPRTFRIFSRGQP